MTSTPITVDVANELHREASVEHGEALCDSCDAVIAREGETVNIGHRCWRCSTEVIGFEPVHL
jgi:hypothetical protein